MTKLLQNVINNEDLAVIKEDILKWWGISRISRMRLRIGIDLVPLFGIGTNNITINRYYKVPIDSDILI